MTLTIREQQTVGYCPVHTGLEWLKGLISGLALRPTDGTVDYLWDLVLSEQDKCADAAEGNAQTFPECELCQILADAVRRCCPDYIEAVDGPEVCDACGHSSAEVEAATHSDNGETFTVCRDREACRRRIEAGASARPRCPDCGEERPPSLSRRLVCGAAEALGVSDGVA